MVVEEVFKHFMHHFTITVVDSMEVVEAKFNHEILGHFMVLVFIQFEVSASIQFGVLVSTRFEVSVSSHLQVLTCLVIMVYFNHLFSMAVVKLKVVILKVEVMRFSLAIMEYFIKKFIVNFVKLILVILITKLVNFRLFVVITIVIMKLDFVIEFIKSQEHHPLLQ
jgi:hypothetical protein